MDELTHNGEQLSNTAADVVKILPYNPQWPVLFAEEATRLRSVLPPGLDVTIEHFGSTAVPVLAAKPVIDIMLIVPGQSRWQSLIEPLKSLNYVYWADNPRPDRMFFVKGMPPLGQQRSHHVHVRLPQDAERELRFRDYLRHHPQQAAQYAALKQELAARFSQDREAYTAAKASFVETVLWQARDVKDHL